MGLNAHGGKEEKPDAHSAQHSLNEHGVPVLGRLRDEEDATRRMTASVRFKRVKKEENARSDPHRRAKSNEEVKVTLVEQGTGNQSHEEEQAKLNTVDGERGEQKPTREKKKVERSRKRKTNLPIQEISESVFSRKTYDPRKLWKTPHALTKLQRGQGGGRCEVRK